MAYISILGDGMLSDHLSKKEVRAASSPGITEIDERLVTLFELVRKYAGNKPLKITSAGRSAAHNAEVGGASSSEHLDAQAFDIALPAARKKQLRKNLGDFMADAIPAGLGGLGVYPGHIHVDTERSGVKYFWATASADHAVRHWSGDGEGLWMTNAGRVPGARHDDGPLAEIDVPVNTNKFPWWILLVIAGYILAKRFKLF